MIVPGRLPAAPGRSVIILSRAAGAGPLAGSPEAAQAEWAPGTEPLSGRRHSMDSGLRDRLGLGADENGMRGDEG
eukprot:767714-Hanusia_phi.AAC.7